MPDFDWKGIKGTQYLTGSITALTRDEAAFKLKEDGVIITHLDKGTAAKVAEEVKEKKSFSLPWRRGVKPIKLLITTKKLSTMLRSGLAILQSLKMVKDQVDDKVLKETFDTIYADVEAGNNLSNAFAKHPRVFDDIYVNLVKAGESSGKLDNFLDKLVKSLAKSIKIRKSIKSAMMYPTILVSVATVVLGVMMIYVVPVFASMFGGIGAALPAPTQFVLSISNFVRDPWGGGLLAVAIVGGVFVFRNALKKSLDLRRKWHQLLLKMPVIGDMILNSNLAQIAMVYGNLTNAGVPVIEALDITANSSKNVVISEAVQQVKRGVFSGIPLSELMLEIKVFPPAFGQLISVGEQTGNMSEMLDTISGYYEEEFDGSVEKLSQLMEPIMICFLGGVIGFILVAMYLPIFKMGQVVTGM